MRVAFLTRDHKDANSREGTLNGLEAVAAGIAAAFEGIHEFVRISVPGTWWDVTGARAPEVQDLSASGWFCNQDWPGYDLVLNNVPGFEPILRVLRVKHALVLHVNWRGLQDTHAHELERFVRFAPVAIAPTKALQARASGLGIPTVYAPFPLLGPSARNPGSSNYDAVWAGRDEPGKGIDLLEGLLRLVASRTVLGDEPPRVGVFLSFCSEERARRLLSLHLPKQVVRIGAPQAEYWDALCRSRAVLCTSQSEAYACAMVEGVLAGAVPVVPGDLGLDHLGQVVEYWERTPEVVFGALTEAGQIHLDQAAARMWAGLRYDPRIGSHGRLWRDQVLRQVDALCA